jgi:serine/threonine-protein kinase
MADPVAHGPTLAASHPDATGPGERLAAGHACGDYVVETFLGTGAMGEVYAGRHPVIGKRVAIKVLRRDAGSSEAAERLVREARATSQIDHPNVIDIFALGRLADGRLYLVMDLVDGRSLRQLLADGPLAPDRALAIVDGIADALDAAHARGVIHRDLKPDNIMIAGERRVHVLDFGLAKLVQPDAPIAPGTLTGQGTWLGTPGYMAPEQWSADGAGPASDRYALGVIAFELLAGVPPFSAPSVPAMMEQHFRAAVPAISAKGKVALPDAVDDVLRRALAKDPAARFPTARALADALRDAMGTAVRPAHAAPPPRAGKRPWLPAVAGAGVLGVGVVAAVALRPGSEAAPAAPPPAHDDEPTIQLTSTPDQAQVLVGGQAAGTTPLSIHLARGASADVTLRKAGYLEAHRSVTASAAFELTPVTGFEGVWRLPQGELRALAREGDRVDVFKLDTVTGPRRFYRHYAFAPADHGAAFASDEEIVDARAPDDPSCHVAVHVEYRYDPNGNTLELRREVAAIGFAGGHCVVNERRTETSALVRADGEADVHETPAPAGDVKVIRKRPPKKAPPKQDLTTGPAPNSPLADKKQNDNDLGQQKAVDIPQGNMEQAANPPPQPAPKSRPIGKKQSAVNFDQPVPQPAPQQLTPQQQQATPRTKK